MASELCALITGPTFEEAAHQLQQAEPFADLVELRLDLFPERPLNTIKHFLDYSPLPVLVTLRKSCHGGNYTGGEDERREEIRQILRLSPSYFDIEEDSSPSFFVEQFPEVSFIISYHTFTAPHPPLETLYEKLQGGTYRKIAIPIKSSTAALETLNYAKGKQNLILIGMGEQGSITRILAPLVNVPWCYAPLKTHTAPGQVPFQTLIDTYRYPKLSPSTKLYGLIGDPISKSISHHLHNALFEEMGWDAIYVKMLVTPEELPDFLKEAHRFGFKGLSVTTPLKEIVMPLITNICSYSSEVRGVNTLIANEGGFSGTNTDGPGALTVLEYTFPVKGKTILLLGAGPAARSIAHEARKRGAHAITTHRNELENLPPYDILINATPLQMPIREEQILPDKIVMDTNVKPLVSPFLKAAKEKNCEIIYGEEMFVEQAVLQFEAWGLGKAQELYPRLSKIAMRRRLTEIND